MSIGAGSAWIKVVAICCWRETSGCAGQAANHQTLHFSGEYEGDEAFHRFLAGPTSIPVIVAGAKNAAISMVVRIFGEWSGTSVPVVEKKN